MIPQTKLTKKEQEMINEILNQCIDIIFVGIEKKDNTKYFIFESKQEVNLIDFIDVCNEKGYKYFDDEMINHEIDFDIEDSRFFV